MEIIAPSVVGLIGVVLGWWIVHFLTSRRDLANKRRDRRLDGMVEVFRELNRVCSFRNVLTPAQVAELLSKVHTGIELYGTKRQVEIFRSELSESLNSGKLIGVRDLINLVRDDVRQSLSLDAIDHPVGEFIFNVPTEKKEAS